MLDVHEKGRAVVASGTREKAEMHVFRLHEHGLWATMRARRVSRDGRRPTPSRVRVGGTCCTSAPTSATLVARLLDELRDAAHRPDDPPTRSRRLFPVVHPDDAERRPSTSG